MTLTVKVIEVRFKETPPIIWTGFARSDVLKWWTGRKGARPATLAADRFAQETAIPVNPSGRTWLREIRAIIETWEPGKICSLRVVMRPATAEEVQQFRRDRMLVIVTNLAAAPTESESCSGDF